MNMARPWDTIEKIDRAFSEFNREQSVRQGGARLTTRAFRDYCVSSLRGITPVEEAAVNRWLASRMRG
jgi:hypothetical protein